MPGKSEGKISASCLSTSWTPSASLSFLLLSSLTFIFLGYFSLPSPRLLASTLAISADTWDVDFQPRCALLSMKQLQPSLLCHFQLYWGITEKYDCMIHSTYPVMIWSMHRSLKGWPPSDLSATSLTSHRYLLVWVREHLSPTLLANFNYIIQSTPVAKQCMRSFLRPYSSSSWKSVHFYQPVPVFAHQAGHWQPLLHCMYHLPPLLCYKVSSSFYPAAGRMYWWR